MFTAIFWLGSLIVPFVRCIRTSLDVPTDKKMTWEEFALEAFDSFVTTVLSIILTAGGAIVGYILGGYIGEIVGGLIGGLVVAYFANDI